MQKLESYLTREGWKKDWNETKEHYKSNRILNINGNILIAAYPSIAIATATSWLMERMGYSSTATSVGAGIADWSAYIPIHIALHYKSNKERFVREDGSFNRKEFAKDVAHVYATQLPSIGLFYVLAIPFQDWMMREGVPGPLANQISYLGTMIATRGVHTAIGMKTGLFKERK